MAFSALATTGDLRALSASVRWGEKFAARDGCLKLSANVLTLRSGESLEFECAADRLENLAWRSFATSFQVSVDGRRFSIGFIPRGSNLSGWFDDVVASRNFRAALAGEPLPARGPFWAIATMWTLNALRIVVALGAAIVFLASALDPANSPGIRILSGVMVLGLTVLVGLGLILVFRKFLK